MKHKSKASIFLLVLLLIFGCLSCTLVLRNYFAPKFSDSEGSVVLNIETYIDGKNQPTHPSVIDMGEEWNGFRYWMAYSPYPNANGAEENPCVCVSNDVIHWVTPDGLYNPIAFNEETDCDELKDPHIVYNSDLDRLEVWYLGRLDSTIKNGGTLMLFRKVSPDGIHWSEYEVIRTLDGYLSPSIAYSGRKYQLWAIQASTNDSGGALVYSESIDGKDWLPFVNCTFDGAPELQKVWHGAVSRDNLYRFVFVEDSGKSKEILYTESADGTTWQEPRTIIQKANFWTAFYRPCILYSNSNFYCIYGVITRDNEWYLSISTGASPDELRGISSKEIGASEINSAIMMKHSIIHLVKDVYHFIQSLCRPELVFICVFVAFALLLSRRSSFDVMWGFSWLLCVLRFYGQLRWLALSDICLLVFTVGIISALCALAIAKLVEMLFVSKRK